MKILTTILTCSLTQDRANACLDTWIRDIKSPHNYFFYGDELQSKTMINTWNCSPDEGEHRRRLPEKTYKMLIESLNHDWDFLFKCDDDTYLNFNQLVEFLQDYNASDDLYIGKQLINPFPYAQGGAGYILTKSSVIKCLNSLKSFYQYESKNNRAEDYSVGLALEMEGIHLNHIDQLNTHAPQIAKKDQSVCVNDIIKCNKITTHYVEAETMNKIYDFIKT
ncbi:fringe family glycosyltransferase [bacterium]|nr:fringe family glycosyltransferase [bacterium]